MIALNSEFFIQILFLVIIVSIILIARRTGKKDLKNAMQSIIVNLFLPTKVSLKDPILGKTILSKTILIFSCILMSVFILFSAPPIRDIIISNFFDESTLKALIKEKEAIISWFEFLSILLEILIAFCIGGLIFTDSISNNLKMVLNKYEDNVRNIFRGKSTDLEDNIQAYASEMLDLIDDVERSNLVYTVERLFRVSSRIKEILLSEVPRIYRNIILLAFPLNFPGGFYGLIAFSLFIFLTIIKILKLYLQSPSIK